MLNLSPLFFTSEDNNVALLRNLDLKPDRKALISEAKSDIRKCLRVGIPAALRLAGYAGAVPAPRFFTQGSWAYGTLNAPAQEPQQADCDDGAYLPLSFVSQTLRPSVASDIFFRAAETALGPLVSTRGWQLVKDKPTCVRVVIADDAHIDIPLYAIPDMQFHTLAAEALQHGFDSVEAAVRKAERDAWTALPSNQVLLAHREEDWKESDPRPVKEWFEGEVAARGEQLRRVVRYLKSFRDWQWATGGPSSILLMAVAAPLFESRHKRDDLALLAVLEQLPSKLRAGVCNPAQVTESLTDRLGEAGVEDAAKRFEEFSRYLSAAVNCTSGSQACAWMISRFGPRFPNSPDLAVAASVASTIAAAPAQRGPSELVHRTKAG